MTKSLYEFTIEELDRELIARTAPGIKEEHFQFDHLEETPERDEIIARVKKLYAAPPSLNKEMEHISTKYILIRLKEMSRGKKKADTAALLERGIIGEDDRFDFYEFEKAIIELEEAIKNQSYPAKPLTKFFEISSDKDNLEKQRNYINMEKIKKNLDATALICFTKDLILEEGWATLKVTSFKERFNLCECERFANQLSVGGRMCTCFLVKENVIATAGHFLSQGKAEDFSVVFGFKMENANTTVTKIPISNVYKVEKEIGKSCCRNGNAPDWALLKLECPAKDRQTVKLSMDETYCDQPVYTIGHPMGLPLKFATGAHIRPSRNEHFIPADLDIFMNNSGSPVFDMESHELIGLVAHGYSTDLRFVNGCWISVSYNMTGENVELSQCTGNSAFRDLLDLDN